MRRCLDADRPIPREIGRETRRDTLLLRPRAHKTATTQSGAEVRTQGEAGTTGDERTTPVERERNQTSTRTGTHRRSGTQREGEAASEDARTEPAILSRRNAPPKDGPLKTSEAPTIDDTETQLTAPQAQTSATHRTQRARRREATSPMRDGASRMRGEVRHRTRESSRRAHAGSKPTKGRRTARGADTRPPKRTRSRRQMEHGRPTAQGATNQTLPRTDAPTPGRGDAETARPTTGESAGPEALQARPALDEASITLIATTHPTTSSERRSGTTERAARGAVCAGHRWAAAREAGQASGPRGAARLRAQHPSSSTCPLACRATRTDAARASHRRHTKPRENTEQENGRHERMPTSPPLNGEHVAADRTRGHPEHPRTRAARSARAICGISHAHRLIRLRPACLYSTVLLYRL
jgi:hypothetical protein